MSDDAPPQPKKSYGNMSPDHWSKTRSGRNREAIEYYRERSKAPGVAEGGAARNFYCMSCDGVIPHDHAQSVCPHCDAELDEHAKRYFNWVEIDEAPQGDFKAVLPYLLLGLGLLALCAWGAWRLYRLIFG